MKNIVLSAVSFFFFLCVAVNAFAATSPNSVSVSPSELKIDLKKDGSVGELMYTNTTSLPVEITLRSTNVTELEDSYRLDYIQNNDVQNFKYGISSWITFDTPVFTIEPGKSTKINVFISDKNLSPGGHYGAILATITPRETTKEVSVTGVLSSLIFVRANTGNEREEATISDITSTQNIFTLPKTVTFRFHNNGNTELIPHGSVQISDTFGNVVSKGIINDSSWITLPETIRKYTVSLTQLSSMAYPGLYTTRYSFVYGEKNISYSQSNTFFYQGSFPLIQIIAFVVGCAGIVLIKKLKNVKK